jgi:chemotaxis protein CheD
MGTMAETVTIKMAEFKVAHNPTILCTIGVGSCVAIAIYDPVEKIGGLAHAMLPDSDSAQARVNPLRFVDKVVEAVVSAMVSLGCRKERMVAKLFGGASMFRNLVNIGGQNVDAAREKLKKEHISIAAEDTGGCHGRSLWFDTHDGTVVVGSISGPTREV